MRWDSPFVLAVAGTLAVHLTVVTGLDALVVIRPYRSPPPAPRVELVEIEPPPVLKPPPPPPPEPPPPEPVRPETPPPPRPQVARTAPRPAPRAAEPPPPTEVPPPSETPGGSEVYHMENVAPAATGVAVASGPRSTGRIGRGGTGGGTGAGVGSGTEVARPVSVAMIKTMPKPKRDYDYIQDYPAEAKALGIEGNIRVRLVVDDTGKVISRVLLNKLGHGLDELALARAAELEFEPALSTDDKPVQAQLVWTFRMTLPK